MSPRFIQPNLHVILIHYPLGLLVVGVFVELFSFLWRRAGIRAAGHWMILIGALSLVPTATSGIYAFNDVVNHGGYADSWESAKQNANISPEEWHYLTRHAQLNALGAGLAILAVITWIGASDLGRRRLYLPLLLVMLVSLGTLIVSSWYGGEMVYRFGLAVKDRQALIDASTTPDAQLGRNEKIEKYLMPMQGHVIMAGLTMSVIAGAIGLALRGAHHHNRVLIERDVDSADVGDALTQPGETVSVGGTGAFVDPAGPAAVDPDFGTVDPAVAPRRTVVQPSVVATPSRRVPGTFDVATALPPRVPSTRWWLVATLIALMTIGGGMYLSGYIHLGDGKPLFDAKHFNEVLQPKPDRYRLTLHFVFGSSILILTLIMAGVTRLAPRSRFMIAVFSLLIVAASALQVREGILLLYDSDHGPGLAFRTREQIAVEQKDEPSAAAAGSNAVDDAKNAAASAGAAIKSGAEKAADVTKSAASSVADTVKSATTTTAP